MGVRGAVVVTRRATLADSNHNGPVRLPGSGPRSGIGPPSCSRSLLTGWASAGCAPTADLVRACRPKLSRAARVVREAYTFAVAHPEVLTQIPCYCGCGAIGHTSNYACYVSGVRCGRGDHLRPACDWLFDLRRYHPRCEAHARCRAEPSPQIRAESTRRTPPSARPTCRSRR